MNINVKIINNRHVANNKTFKITTIDELESFLRNPPVKLRYKPNDFIKFRDSDKEYINSIIKTDVTYNRTSLFEEFLSKIFKYKTMIELNYWLVRGWNNEDAIKKIKEIQSARLKRMHQNRKQTSNWREKYNTCLEYWLKQGYSYDDAKIKLKERQSTFSKDKCIQKYGNDGINIFNQRQEKWLNTLYSNMNDAERLAFEESKMLKFGKASKASLDVFLKVIEYFKLKNEEYYLGVEGNKEYCILNKEKDIVFFYDFTIPKYKCIIEFNGLSWHPNGESWEPLYFVENTKEELLLKNDLKIKTAKENGYDVLEIWDNHSIEDNVKKCIEFLCSLSSMPGKVKA